MKGAVLDPAALDRFRGEVRNARQITHPHVCRVYDIGEHEGRTFLSMEYVDGEDLASLLRRIGRLPVAKANEIAQQICAGLAVAHSRQILHRDLKPSNVGATACATVVLGGKGKEAALRGKLCGLVWSEPLKTLSERFGISGIALKKSCVLAGIPTPERGYWGEKSRKKYVLDRR